MVSGSGCRLTHSRRSPWAHPQSSAPARGAPRNRPLLRAPIVVDPMDESPKDAWKLESLLWSSDNHAQGVYPIFQETSTACINEGL